MKIIIAENRDELNELIDALEATDQEYVVEKVQMMRDTGRVKTTKIYTAWRVIIDPPHEEEEELPRIGFVTTSEDDTEEEADIDWDDWEE